MPQIVNQTELFNRIVETTANYLIKNEIKATVLGISGGIDSTVCAAICYEIKQRYGIKFIGISLPCSTNKDDENASAMYCMSAFCSKFWTENLESCYQFVKNTCAEKNNSNATTRGNIKARLRMIYLYHVAAMNKGIVIDTDNLTEKLLGFFTVHGDQGDYKPIGFLWKHQVYDLAQGLLEVYKDDEQKKKALECAIKITPTDGNGVKEGGDLAQIAPGSTYNEVDDILQKYTSRHAYRPYDMFPQLPINEEDKVITELYEKYPKKIVDGVITRHEKSRFKRKKGLPYLGVRWEDIIRGIINKTTT